MASLSSLLGNKSLASVAETNLAQGEVYLYAGNGSLQEVCDFCWLAPADGEIVIEMWGAAGSSSRMCCCGMGLPGNTGAYAKTQVISIEQGQFLCGCVGHSCGNASSLCFRGCSNPTEICVEGVGCICAEGGRSGFSRCRSGGSMYCCFLSCNFCGTRIGSSGCGIICNISSSYSFVPDLNVDGINLDKCYPGQISCMFFGHCNSECWRYHKPIVAIPPGIFSEEVSYVTYFMDCCCNRSGQAWSGFKNALMGMSTTRSYVSDQDFCWDSGIYCGCREGTGCQPMVPPGIPAPGSSPCSSVRDNGQYGGHGAIKIRFKRN